MKPSHCLTCPLYEKGQGYVVSDGTGRNGVILLGEALGASEVARSLPFAGDAGFQLNRTLQRTSLERKDFTITNCVRCRPPNNWMEGAPWEKDALEHCSHYLAEIINERKPKVIMPMGNVALHACLGRRGIMKLRGYVYKATVHGHGCFILPTIHPSAVMRGTAKTKGSDASPNIPPFALTSVSMFDLLRAARVAKDGYVEPKCNYIEVPSAYDLELFITQAEQAARDGLWLACDIETPNTHGTTEDEYGEIIDAEINCVSFAFKAGHAITIPWTRAHHTDIQRILDIRFTYITFWNADFDVPRIKATGVGIGPRVIDSMWMWHFLQSNLPKGLGFVSTFFTELTEWKSLASDFPTYYSCRDADATIQCAYAIRDQLLREGRFDAFVHYVVELDPILKRMGSKGVLIDRDQATAFRSKMEAERVVIDGHIQEVVPESLKPSKKYKRVPDDATLGGTYRGGVWVADKETGVVDTLVFPFLPSSSKQVKEYMRFRGHPVPRHHKTHEETTGKDDLERLGRAFPKEPLYRLIVQGRELQKMIGQYCDGYQPDADGRLRTHFGFAPSTGRLSSFSPNVQNIIKHKGWAKEFRKQFIAGPGHVIVEFDFKGIEALLVGWLSGDSEYIKACKAGVHAILASHVLNTPIKLDAPDITAQVKALKQAHAKTYEDSKHVVHGSNYGGTPFKIKMDFPESFPSLKHAEAMQKLYFDTIGKGVRQWQRETMDEAHKKCYLDTVFGFRHYFWAVYMWDSRKGCMGWGPDGKESLAFRPQSMAADILKDSIMMLPPDVLDCLHWNIHDALVFEFPIDRLDEYVGITKARMERPIPELGGLTVEVEVTIGRNWGEMQDYS